MDDERPQEPLYDEETEQERHDLELSRPRPWETAVIAAVPYVGPFIAEYQKAMWQEEADRFFFRANQRALNRVVQTMQEIRLECQLEPEMIIERLNADDRLADLLNETLRAAARSRIDAKRKALGRVFARTLEDHDDAAVDDVEMVITALGQLEAAHVRVLALMREDPPFETKPVTVQGLQVLYPELSGTIEALLLQLRGWGMVKIKPPTFMNRGRGAENYVAPSDLARAEDHVLTGLGIEVCRELEAAGSGGEDHQAKEPGD